jgi:hypothetical protein
MSSESCISASLDKSKIATSDSISAVAFVAVVHNMRVFSSVGQVKKASKSSLSFPETPTTVINLLFVSAYPFDFLSIPTNHPRTETNFSCDFFLSPNFIKGTFESN